MKMNIIIYYILYIHIMVLDSWQVMAWKVQALLYIQQGASLEAFLIFFWKQNETFPHEKKNRG